MTIRDADIAADDARVDADAAFSLRFTSLEFRGVGEIVDFDYLEIEGDNAWRALRRSTGSNASPALAGNGPGRAPSAVDALAPMVHPDRFRQALAHLPAPVTLVTCASEDDAPIGATVSAFSSLSLDPPLVMVSLDRQSGTLAAIQSRGAFAVHVLGDGHRPLAIRFAERRTDKFREVEFERNDRGVPLLPHYSFRFECVLHDEFPGGDHAILVGAVEELSEHDVAQDPVVWYGRAFQRLQADEA